MRTLINARSMSQDMATLELSGMFQLFKLLQSNEGTFQTLFVTLCNTPINTPTVTCFKATDFCRAKHPIRVYAISACN
jgi:hypothetical protein